MPTSKNYRYRKPVFKVILHVPFSEYTGLRYLLAMEKWPCANINERWNYNVRPITADGNNNVVPIEYMFLSEEDAIHFKLIWA